MRNSTGWIIIPAATAALITSIFLALPVRGQVITAPGEYEPVNVAGWWIGPEDSILIRSNGTGLVKTNGKDYNFRWGQSYSGKEMTFWFSAAEVGGGNTVDVYLQDRDHLVSKRSGAVYSRAR
jgi:hypothetical protein